MVSISVAVTIIAASTLAFERNMANQAKTLRGGTDRVFSPAEAKGTTSLKRQWIAHISVHRRR